MNPSVTYFILVFTLLLMVPAANDDVMVLTVYIPITSTSTTLSSPGLGVTGAAVAIPLESTTTLSQATVTYSPIESTTTLPQGEATLIVYNEPPKEQDTSAYSSTDPQIKESVGVFTWLTNLLELLL